MLEHIRVVLIRTFHPGNIGSAARAMKTMGLSQLYLVDPWRFPDEEAEKLAAGASDVLANATVVSTFYEAVKDCHSVIASTARPRNFDLPELDPERMATQLLGDAHQSKPCALVFGPERYGITNEDLALAKHRVTIAANPEYSSLNLAAAVQTLCYEIYKTSRQQPTPESTHRLPASTENLERFFDALEETYQRSGFIRPQHPGEVVQKLRQLYQRAELDEGELQILRGTLSSVGKFLPPKRPDGPTH